MSDFLSSLAQLQGTPENPEKPTDFLSQLNSLQSPEPNRSLTGNRISAGIDQYQAGLLGLGEAVAGKVGATGVEESLRERREQNESAAEAALRQARAQGGIESYKDVTGVGSALNYVGGLAAQSLPYVGESLVGGIGARALMGGTKAALRGAIEVGDVAGQTAARSTLAKGSLLGGTAASYPSAVGDVLSNQRDQNGETNLGTAAALGVPYAALNAFGVEGALAKQQGFRVATDILDSVSGVKGAIARGVTTGVGVGAQEAVSETAQEALNQVGRMSVDPTEKFLNERSKEAFLESAVGGFALGGLAGSIGGGMRRSQGSFLPGSTDSGSLDVSSKPDNNAINKAIDENSTEIATDTNQQVTAVQQQVAELDQVRAQAKQEADAVAQQQAIEQQQVQQQQSQEAFTQVAQTYGLKPGAQAGQFNVAGKILFTQNDAVNFLKSLDELNAGKTEEQKGIIGATLASGAVKVNADANPKTINNAVNKFLTGFGLDSAVNKTEAAERANTIISTMEGGTTLKKAEPLNNFYRSVTGQDAPAFTFLVQQTEATKPTKPKGVQDGQLQVQDNAGLRAVSEQGGTTQISGNQPGNVRPPSVQSIESGSVGAGSLGLQTGAVPSSGISTSTNTGGSGLNISNAGAQAQAQGQVNEAQRTGSDQEGRGALSGQAIEGNRTPEQQAEETATNIVESVIKGVIDAVVTRKGRMSKENLAKLKEFIYYDASQIEDQKNGLPGLSKKELSEMFGVSTDVIDGWQDISRNFFEQNRGVIQAQIYQALDKNGITLLELKEAVQAKRDTTLNDAIILEEGQQKEASTQDDEQAAKEEVSKEVAAADQELTEVDESQLDQRDLGAEDSGMTVMTGRKGISVQEQNKPEETVNAQIKKALEKYNEAVATGNEELEASLMAKIDELTAEAKRLNDLIVSKGEAKNAVQKPSAKSKTVGDKPKASKGVRKQDTEERKAATESKAQTEEELAAEAWDRVAKRYPEAPLFADLTKEQQKDWISYGKENWTADDVQTELVKLAKKEAAGIVINKNVTKQRGKVIATPEQIKFLESLDFTNAALPDVDANGQPISHGVAITTLDALNKQFPGVAKATEALASTHEHLFDAIDSVGVVDSYEFGAAITTEIKSDGKVVNWLMLTKKTLETSVPGAQAFTIVHEFGHLADMAGNGGAYSNNVDLSVRKKGKDFIMYGSVVKELFKYYEANKNSDDEIATLFAYPFEDSATMDAKEFQQEVFAQLWASYYNTTLSAKLQNAAPNAYKFIEEAYNHAEEKRSVVPGTASSARTKATIIETTFTNRYKGSGTQSTSGLPGQPASTEQVTVRKSKSIDDLREQAKSNLDKIPSSIRGPFRAIHDALFNAKETALSVMLTIDVAKLASKYMPSAMDYFEVNNKRSAIESAITEKLDKILVTAQDELNAADRVLVNRLIEDSTIKGLWAFDPNIAGVTDKDIDPELAARFKAIGNPKAKQVIRDVFKFWNETLMQEQEAIRSEIDATFAERLANATETEKKAIEARKKDVLDKFSAILKAKANSPYAPLKRFGPFVVVAKSQEYIDAEKNLDAKWLKENQADEKHYVVEFAETSSEAEAMYDSLKKLGYDQVEKPFKKSESKDVLYSSIDLYKAFTQLKKTISAEKAVSNTAESVDLYSKMNELVDELYLMSLSENSARKSELQRKGVAGLNRALSGDEARDMLRATFSQGAAKAKHIANLKTNDESLQTMIKMQKEAQSNRAEAYPYLNELIAREAQSLQVRERSMLDGVNRLTGDWFLTFSPGFYFQQAAQTYVLSVPWLAGKVDGNYGKAFGAVTTAYKDIMPLVKGSKLREHLDFSKAPKDVREMLENLVSRGAINIGIESELLSHRSVDENVVTATYNKVTNKLRGGINRIEALNRASAATAAYRLEMAKSGSKEKATQAAFDVVKETHGLYDGSNTPRLFNKNAFTRSIFQFRRFQIIQLTTLARIMKDAVAGAGPLEKAIARKQFAFMVGHSLALAGVKGLPLYGLASLAYTLGKAAFGDEDDPKDFEAWLRTHGGLLLARGIPAFMGVDVSGKLGQGNVTSVLPYTDIDLTSRGGIEKLVIGLAGPFAGGLLPKMADGAGLMLGGQYYKGLEQVLPNGFGGVMKGARFTTEGITNRRGDLVMSPDEISFADGMMQALGLPTTKLSERQYLQGQLIKTDQFYNDKATEIKGSYTRAVKEGDVAASKEAQADWKSLQASRKENGYTVQPLSVLLKAPQEQKKRERNTVGGVAVTKSNKGFAQRTSEQT